MKNLILCTICVLMISEVLMAATANFEGLLGLDSGYGAGAAEYIDTPMDTSTSDFLDSYDKTAEKLKRKEKYIQLEGNTYQIENICYNGNKISDKKKSFNRYYKFTFNSKHNVFENYNNNAGYSIQIMTNLYNFTNDAGSLSYYTYADNAPTILQNKKTIEIVLSEGNMKKLYESNSAKVVFPISLFSNKYSEGYYNLVPVISIALNKNDFDYELEKCNKKYNKYSKEYDDYHSKPMNRIKTFFNFN